MQSKGMLGVRKAAEHGNTLGRNEVSWLREANNLD